MNINYRIYDIEYDFEDTYGIETEADILALNIPKELVMTVNDADCLVGTTDHLEGLLSDYISDTTGFCHNGFKYERLEKKD